MATILLWCAPVADADGLVDLALIAAPDAAAAHDALGEVPDDHAVVIFVIVLGVRGVGKAGGGDFIAIGQGLEFALAIGLADQAVVVAGAQQQFQDHLAGGVNPGRFGFDHHAGVGHGGAGRQQGPGTFHFHHAHATRSGGGGIFHIAQGGDGDRLRAPGPLPKWSGRAGTPPSSH